MNRVAIPKRLAVVVSIILAVCCASPAVAVTHLARGMVAPPIELPDVDGRTVRTADLRGRPVVIIFGELYHDKTLQACEQVHDVLADPRLTAAAPTSILIVSQDAEPDELRAMAATTAAPATILHDRDRSVYETYRVAVLPSVVVLDADGRVVHAIAALTMRFSDVLTDALLLATGQIDLDQFQQTLHPTAPAETDTNQARAARLTQLARQLARRGLGDMAAQKYAEALELVPQYPEAHLGLGLLQLKRQHLAEAEQRFRTVLDYDPDSVDASLGLAYVQTLRGGAELDPAEQQVRRVLANHPTRARAHYLLGLIAEARGDVKQAAASFKRAAAIAIERTEWETMQ